MPTKADWLALAERCEKAEWQDDLLSYHIRSAANWSATINLTGSLDAITALIREKLPGRGFHFMQPSCTKIQPWAVITGDDAGEAATPALALCSAFCRAMAEQAHD